MEDILNKDIFIESDLCKLEPDYQPRDIVLRMQMRGTLVKDTQNRHRNCNISGFQRKTIQKKSTKDTIKMNKEIVKLKNAFATSNLKNEIMMKHTGKHNEIVKQKKQPHKEKQLILKDFDTENYDYVLMKQHCNDTSESNDNEEYEIDENLKIDNLEDIITVSKFNKGYNDHYSKDIKNNTARNGICDTENVIFENIDTILDTTTKTTVDSKDVGDLQSLLIMMAISPKDSDREHTYISSDYTDVFYEDDRKNSILVSPRKQNEDKMDFLNIIPLKNDTVRRQEMLLKKYVNKWKLYTKNKKEALAQLRQSTLNSFFNKLEKKKMNPNQQIEDSKHTRAKLLVNDYNTYQHRYKVQKHVIALQKAKLEEQNRLIDELKYNKIVEASKQSVDTLKDEVRKTYSEIDRQLKPKIKCLTNELNLHEIEEPSLVLHCLKVPQFLQRMEQRAREREEKHAIIRERRRQMEEDQLRLKQQAELAKAEMDKEEKIKIIKELREKRKRDKIESIRKKQHAERMRSLKVMADLHYERNLMMKCGLRPWIKLIKIKKDSIKKAKAHNIFQLKKNVFLHWMWHTEDMWFDRNYKAEDWYRKNILRKGFEAFKMNHYDYVVKKQVAQDYSELYLLQLGFRKLQAAILLIKRENNNKLLKAEAYYNSNLLFKAFTLWRTLPALNALKREQDARKMRWRQKVLQVVPDYTPPDD